MKRYVKCGICVLLMTLLALDPVTARAEENKETVYVLADALGQPKRIFVNEQMEGEASTETMEESEKAVPLPVEVSFRYELDGESIDPAELAGKSGHLTIYIDYASMLTGTALVKGENTEIPMPFLAATVLPFDEEACSNVEVTNGHVIREGRLSMAVCFGLPGLKEALHVGGHEGLGLDISIPSSAVFSADVTDFASDGFYTIVAGMPEILAEGETPFGIRGEETVAGLETGKDLVETGMDDALVWMNALVTGVDGLRTGAGTLREGTAALSKGLDELDGNSGALTDGAAQLVDGILEAVNETLLASADAFSQAGIELNTLTLDNYKDEVARMQGDFLKAVEARVYEQAEEDLELKVTDAVRAQVAEKVTAAVREQVSEEVTAKVRENVSAVVEAALPEMVREEVTAAVREQVAAQVTSAISEQIQAKEHETQIGIKAPVFALVATDEVQEAIERQVSERMESDEVVAMIEEQTAARLSSEEVLAQAGAQVDSQMATEAIQATISGEIEKAMQDKEAQAAVEENLEEQMAGDEVAAAIRANVEEQKSSDAYLSATRQAIEENGVNSETYQTLEALVAKLDGVKAFYDGLTNYTAGVGQAAQGAEEVAEGTVKLEGGLAVLDNGIQTIKGYVDQDAKEFLDCVKAVANLRYKGYLDESADATVFIIHTEGIYS